MKEIIDQISGAGKTVKLAIGILLVVILGLVDYYTTSEISFSIFYLLPISFVSWYTGKWNGIAFSLLCAVIWFLMDSMSTHSYSFPAIPYWNGLVRFGFFVIVVLLIWKVKMLKENLEFSVVERTKDLIAETERHKRTKEETIAVNNRLRELNKKIDNIKEEQNSRIAREVHDELGQSLTAMNLELMWISKKYSGNEDLVNRMTMLSGLVGDTISTVRKISSDLRPRLLDQLGLFPAIESQLKDFSKRTSIETLCSFPEQDIKLESSASTTIFRIFQEALTNISRHSGCKFVSIVFSQPAENMLVMQIRDDGKGFDTKAAMNSKGMGILGMNERAHILGGTLEIISTADSGTEIILKTPV